jgi:DNA-directed RNA polymerase specialized sigma subunit
MQRLTYVFPGVFAPVVSLDALIDSPGADGLTPLDIADDGLVPADEAIAQTEVQVAVTAFIDALTERDRLIVERLFWLGQTQAKIAADLGISKMAVNKAVARICRQGRTQLAPYASHW